MVMGVFDILFIINLAVMIGIAAYHCYKKEKATVVYNLVVISLFILIKFTQVYYDAIRAQIFRFLGEDLFNDLRELLSVLLFFGSSVTVGVQLVSELLSIIFIFLLAARVASILLTNKGKKLFDKCVCPEEKERSYELDRRNKHLFLVLKRLLN